MTTTWHTSMLSALWFATTLKIRMEVMLSKLDIPINYHSDYNPVIGKLDIDFDRFSLCLENRLDTIYICWSEKEI